MKDSLKGKIDFRISKWNKAIFNCSKTNFKVAEIAENAEIAKIILKVPYQNREIIVLNSISKYRETPF